MSPDTQVGRGLQPLTRYLNHNAHGAGGNPWTTYAPLPYYVTSQGRSVFLKNTEVGTVWGPLGI